MFKYILKKFKENRGNLGALFGGGDSNEVANIQTPTFQTDPNFTNSQNQLATLGQNVLSGNLPSFYSGLGKSNSPQFQSMIQNITGQTQNAAQQQEAAQGTGRSGVGAAASALALNNVIPGLNYQDLLNSQQQQQGLLNFGAGLTENVAGNALANQGQENNFAQQNFQDQFQQGVFDTNYNTQQSSALGSLIGTGIGVAGGATLGGISGGPMGALAGGLQEGGFGNFSSFLSGLNTAGGSSGTGITSNTAPLVPGMGAYNANLNGLTFASGA